ncbi:DUF1223 domain-containing protein [Flavobacterium sp. MAH-1]|uniref:DUF1223 domain-containing protein n=1 Tax=Flavobacterium agri TaxID=2743471 RepID=A0A7Y8XZ69_9FLAO|nr:DUF1223 domain-containing protein [Flavobacterium agri]NUY79538.1 DUF1223 domain-containing protein [Flavobacterium agri]NYA69563.1 DUF1223 domain-containing protein [Flavobacterium agri]
MKPIKIFAICAGIALLASSLAFVTDDTGNKAIEPQPIVANGDGFAVLELFTSEGCSSCPPADKLLGRIQQQYKDKPVYVLAYHVDYWDRLGWKDQFSSLEFTNRQYAYTQSLKSEMYTPQVVLNGKSEFVGSNAKVADESLEAATKGTPKAKFDVQARTEAGNIHFDYTFDRYENDGILRMAIVQKHAVSQVKRGENEGRTLDHWQIVRKLHTFRLNPYGKGSNQFKIPQGFNTKDWEIIGMVQNEKDGKIIAATRASFAKQ